MPNVPVQIAHLAGTGEYHDPGIDAAFGVFADAIAAKDIVMRLRMLGLDRVLYGSDSPPLAAWKAFRKLPPTAGEFGGIEKNIAPYLR